MGGGVLSGGVPEQGGAAAWRRPSGPGCPGDPAQAFGWMLAQRVQQNSNNKTR